jgi:hypothetical protein
VLQTYRSFDIRYEGPGWKSNKIGYRLLRTGDVCTEKTEAIILPQVGQDGFDSYHEMSDWGSDILKAGRWNWVPSIGI